MASRSLVDLWRRVPSGAARLLGGATERVRPLRALAVLLVVTVLGTGGYVAGRAMTDEPTDGRAERADPTPTYDDGGPEPTPGAPTSDDRTPGGRSAEPSASAVEESDAPSPTTTRTQSPRAGLASATRSPSTGSVTPSTSPSTSPPTGPSTGPSQTGTTTSATPKDNTPPQTSVSEGSAARDVALFTFSANEPATYTCSLDEAAYTSCGSPLRYLDLAAGWHSLAVRATDTAGNTDPTPAESRWHSDKGDPAD